MLDEEVPKSIHELAEEIKNERFNKPLTTGGQNTRVASRDGTRKLSAQGTDFLIEVNDKSVNISNSISNTKDIGLQTSESQALTIESRQDLRHDGDNLEDFGEDLQGALLGIPPEERIAHGDLVRKFRRFLFDNRDIHHKKDVALAIGTEYKNRSYLKILEREKGKTFRYLYGGDRASARRAESAPPSITGKWWPLRFFLQYFWGSRSRFVLGGILR